jgi:glyoxylase-like metal-dependent hydrolase (beta-lactamase superfamily II)
MVDSGRRDFLRTVIAGVTIFPLPRTGSAQIPPKIKPAKLTDHISMLSGDGVNIGLILSEEGLMMIDGGYANRVEELQETVAGVDRHPVKILFNTHWHVDHVGSNEMLGKSGVKIMAHQNTKYWLTRHVDSNAFTTPFDPMKPEGWPTQVFTESGKMTFGKEKIEYKWCPNAHTNGDAYLFFPAANVLHTGDLMFNGTYPVVDYITGGWIGGMATALDRLLKIGDEKTQIIPGHGPLATKADMRTTRDMLHTVFDRLDKISKTGAGVDEVVKMNPLADLEPKWGQGFLKGDRFLRMAYPSLAAHAELVKTSGNKHVGW